MLNEYGIEIFPNINKLSSNHHLQERFKKLFDAFAKMMNSAKTSLQILPKGYLSKPQEQ
jgi:hypothetical protein